MHDFVMKEWSEIKLSSLVGYRVKRLTKDGKALVLQGFSHGRDEVTVTWDGDTVDGRADGYVADTLYPDGHGYHDVHLCAYRKGEKRDNESE